MARNPRKKYRPDYGKLYPGIEITPAVMNVLKKSDRKMEYQECDLKNPRVKKDQAGNVVGTLPPREDSLDEHIAFNQQFKDDCEDTEQAAIARIQSQQLYEVLAMLNDDERVFIHAIFFEQITEAVCAKRMGIKQQSLNERKRRVLGKIKKLLQI